MQKYHIPISYTVTGTIEVEAVSINEAEAIAKNNLYNDGENAITDTTDREYDVTHRAEPLN